MGSGDMGNLYCALDDYAIEHMKLFCQTFTFGKLAKHGFLPIDKWDFEMSFPNGRTPSERKQGAYSSSSAFTMMQTASALPIHRSCYAYQGKPKQSPTAHAINAAAGCARIWKETLAKTGFAISLDIKQGREGELARKLVEMEATGRAIGIDEAVEAYLSGAPIAHVIG